MDGRAEVGDTNAGSAGGGGGGGGGGADPLAPREGPATAGRGRSAPSETSIGGGSGPATASPRRSACVRGRGQLSDDGMCERLGVLRYIVAA